MNTPFWPTMLAALILLQAGMPPAAAADSSNATSTATVAPRPPTPIPSYNNSVIDVTGTLTQDHIESLSSTVKEIKKKTGSELAILMIPTLGGQSIEQYAERVNDKWNLGHFWKRDGILLLIAKDDRKMRISVGSALNDLFDGEPSARILREALAPSFSQGRFFEGIADGIGRVSFRIESKMAADAPPKKSDSAKSRTNRMEPDITPTPAGLQTAMEDAGKEFAAAYGLPMPRTINWDYAINSCEKLLSYSYRCYINYTNKHGRQNNKRTAVMRTSRGWEKCDDPAHPESSPKVSIRACE